MKLKILADTSRLSIIKLLMDGPQHVYEINRVLDLEQSLLSHHLRVLREAGFVQSMRDGKAMLYSLTPEIFCADQQQGLNLGCCELSFTTFTTT
jgi:DNA-binding transcriptional ArsR family regulator